VKETTPQKQAKEKYRKKMKALWVNKVTEMHTVEYNLVEQLLTIWQIPTSSAQIKDTQNHKRIVMCYAALRFNHHRLFFFLTKYPFPPINLQT